MYFVFRAKYLLVIVTLKMYGGVAMYAFTPQLQDLLLEMQMGIIFFVQFAQHTIHLSNKRFESF